MYAVFKTGGKQYRAEPGETVRVEKLPGSVGDAITLDQVLMVGGEALTLRQARSWRRSAKVEAKIVDQGLGQEARGLQVPPSQGLPPQERAPPAVHRARNHQDQCLLAHEV